MYLSTRVLRDDRGNTLFKSITNFPYPETILLTLITFERPLIFNAGAEKKNFFSFWSTSLFLSFFFLKYPNLTLGFDLVSVGFPLLYARIIFLF